MNDRELDAEFERIISGWDDEAYDPHARPAGSDEDGGAGESAAPAGDTAGPAPDAGPQPTATGEAAGRQTSDPAALPEPVPDARPDAPADHSAGGLSLSIAPMTPHVWRGSPVQGGDADTTVDDTEPDDGHFEPPTLTDLPNAEDDPMFWAIVVGLGGGPLLLLYLLIFDREGSGWWVATALAMTVVGFVLLVLRGGNERDPFDDGTRV